MCAQIYSTFRIFFFALNKKRDCAEDLNTFCVNNTLGEIAVEAWEASKNALENVLEAVAGESIFVVCDDEKLEVGKAFADGALALGLWT